VRFFDASAIVKRYVREVGSARVRRLLRHNAAVSRLTEVEVASALARLVRNGNITAAQRDRAARALERDLTAWTVVEITAEVAAEARRLLLLHELRAGDAIQLASALVLQRGLGEPLEEFIVYDARLSDAAEKQHLPLRRGR
jgi:predicted nucleic acid-binding protein